MIYTNEPQDKFLEDKECILLVYGSSGPDIWEVNFLKKAK